MAALGQVDDYARTLYKSLSVSSTAAPSDASLLQEFQHVRKQVLQLQYAQLDKGLWSIVVSRLLSLLTFTHVPWLTTSQQQEHGSTAALMSHTELMLHCGDYAGAATLLNQLQEWPWQVAQEYTAKL